MARTPSSSLMQELAMGIASSIEAGLKESTEHEVGFVLIMTDAKSGRSGVSTNLDRRSTAKLLRRALDSLYSDN